MSPRHREPDREQRFADLFDATYAEALRFVQRRVPPSRAEDVVADAFLVAWRRLDAVPAEPDAARAWLFGVARATLLNERRGARRRSALAVRLADQPGAGLVEDAGESVQARLDLARAWTLLTQVHQEAIALSVLDGLTSAQAATVLDISPVAYRLRLSRARRALRLHLTHAPATPRPAALSERTDS